MESGSVKMGSEIQASEDKSCSKYAGLSRSTDSVLTPIDIQGEILISSFDHFEGA